MKKTAWTLISILVVTFGAMAWLMASIPISHLKKSALSSPIHAGFSLSPMARMIMSASAESVGDQSCETEYEAKTSLTLPNYAHGALSHYSRMFYLISKVFPADTENALCHFVRSMGMKPDLSALPQLDITKVFGSVTVELDVEVPDESWATGVYDARGTVYVNGTKYMVLWWAKASGDTDGTKTKGFMLEGSNGISDAASAASLQANEGGDDRSGKRVTAVRWDLTDDSAQTSEVVAAKWSSTYDGFAEAIADNDSSIGAIWGKVVYNNSTSSSIRKTAVGRNARNLLLQNLSNPKGFTVQVSTIEVRDEGGNVPKGYRMAGSGTLKFVESTADANVSVAKEDSAIALTNSDKDSTGMSGVSLPNSVDTANACQGNNVANCSTLTASELEAVVGTFRYSIQDLAQLGASGHTFAAGDADFTTCPAAVFEGGSCD